MTNAEILAKPVLHEVDPFASGTARERVTTALRAHAHGLTLDEIAATTLLPRLDVGNALRELWMERRAASMWQDGPWYLIPPTVEG